MTEGQPAPLLCNVYIVFAFLNALFWINLIADDLVALLQVRNAAAAAATATWHSLTLSDHN